eukprot:6149977-Karenia_brevis.AAC.1
MLGQKFTGARLARQKGRINDLEDNVAQINNDLGKVKEDFTNLREDVERLKERDSKPISPSDDPHQHEHKRS